MTLRRWLTRLFSRQSRLVPDCSNDNSATEAELQEALADLQSAVDRVLQYIDAISVEDPRAVDELAFEYLHCVATTRDYALASDLGRRFVCRFCEWVGAVSALKALRQDRHFHSWAVKVATEHLQLPPRPPAPKRRAA